MNSKLEATNKKVGEIEQKLDAATKKEDELDQKLIDFGNGLPAVKKVVAKKAVDKILRSDWFYELLALQHNGG